VPLSFVPGEAYQFDWSHVVVVMAGAVMTRKVAQVRLSAVAAACAEALREGVHSTDVVLNILARQREPAPAVTILTPEALWLRHQPVADCARHDSLRSSA